MLNSVIRNFLNLFFKTFQFIFCDFFAFFRFFASSIASRRMLRIATLAFSPTFFTSFAKSRRVSSVKAGITKRITDPSLAGGYQGQKHWCCLMSSKMIYQMVWSTRHALRNSDRCQLVQRSLYSVVFYENTIQRLAFARPARMLPNSRPKLWWDWVILSFAFSTIGFAIIFLYFLLFFYIIRYGCTNIFTKDNAFDIAWFIHIKDNQVNVVVHGESRGCWVHDAKTFVDHITVSQFLKFHSWSIFFGSAL